MENVASRIYTSHFGKKSCAFRPWICRKSNFTENFWHRFPVFSHTNAADFAPCLLNFQDGGFYHEKKDHSRALKRISETQVSWSYFAQKKVNILRTLKTFSLGYFKELTDRMYGIVRLQGLAISLEFKVAATWFNWQTSGLSWLKRSRENIWSV